VACPATEAEVLAEQLKFKAIKMVQQFSHNFDSLCLLTMLSTSSFKRFSNIHLISDVYVTVIRTKLVDYINATHYSE
jgi:hypothetical protein